MKWRRPLLRAALAFGLVLAAMQIRQPTRTNPRADSSAGVERNVVVPAAVLATLKRACYDCHSNETRWPLYSRVAPVSWLIARHVRMGREDLNFSEWILPPGREPTPEQNLAGICRDVREGIMPPRSYTVLHPASVLTASDRRMLCSWTQRERRALRVAGSPPDSVAVPRSLTVGGSDRSRPGHPDHDRCTEDRRHEGGRCATGFEWLLAGRGGPRRVRPRGVDHCGLRTGCVLRHPCCAHVATLGRAVMEETTRRGEAVSRSATWKDSVSELRLVTDPNRSAWTVRRIVAWTVSGRSTF